MRRALDAELTRVAEALHASELPSPPPPLPKRELEFRLLAIQQGKPMDATELHLIADCVCFGTRGLQLAHQRVDAERA